MSGLDSCLLAAYVVKLNIAHGTINLFCPMMAMKLKLPSTPYQLRKCRKKYSPSLLVRNLVRIHRINLVLRKAARSPSLDLDLT